jgi:hypothetical protein
MVSKTSLNSMSKLLLVAQVFVLASTLTTDRSGIKICPKGPEGQGQILIPLL